MIPVQLTCESERVPPAGGDEGLRHRPLIRLNGQALWRGRPEPTAQDAERVALAYLRYALGGALTGPADPPVGSASAQEPRPTGVADALAEAVETLGRELEGALRRVGDFLERGDWRRFMG